MLNLFEDDQEVVTLGYRDTLMLLTGSVLMILVLILLVISDKSKAAYDIQPKGKIIVDIAWPGRTGTDMDIWLADPIDRIPISFNRHHGDACDLVRDDLGKDDVGQYPHYENVTCRKAPAGQYIVDVNMYSNQGGYTDIPVQVDLKFLKANGDVESKHEVKMVFTKTQVDQTAFVFNLDDKGELVPGSLQEQPATYYLSNNSIITR